MITRAWYSRGVEHCQQGVIKTRALARPENMEYGGEVRKSQYLSQEVEFMYSRWIKKTSKRSAYAAFSI
jgi:hypothetical protein